MLHEDCAPYTSGQNIRFFSLKNQQKYLLTSSNNIALATNEERFIAEAAFVVLTDSYQGYLGTLK